MIKQTQLKFNLGSTKDEITPRAGLAVYSEFLRGFGVKDLIDRQMPLPGSNRGYRALRRLIGLKDIPSALTVGDWLRRTGGGEGIGFGRNWEFIIRCESDAWGLADNGISFRLDFESNGRMRLKEGFLMGKLVSLL